MISILTEGAIFGIMALGPQRDLGMVGRFRPRLLRLHRGRRVHDPGAHHRPATAPAHYILGLAAALSGGRGPRRDLFHGGRARRRLDRPAPSARHLFLDRHAGSGLRHVRLGRPVRAALRRLQRAVRSVRPDGRLVRPRLPVVSVVLDGPLPRHVRPGAPVHVAALRAAGSGWRCARCARTSARRPRSGATSTG